MPSYKDNDPKGWGGDPRRGAAMGRSTVVQGDPIGKMTLRKVRMSACGAYDSNGTYFGTGQPLYWYADEGGNVDCVIRAEDRDKAKEFVLAEFPSARFYR